MGKSIFWAFWPVLPGAGFMTATVAAPDTVFAGVTSPRLTHPQLLGFKEVNYSLYPTTGKGLGFLIHQGVMAGFIGGVRS